MAAKKGKGVVDAPAQRLNVRVSAEAYERLLIHAIKARVSPGELVTKLIDGHLKDWRVQSNGGQSKGSVEIAGQREQSEPVAA